jgi:hypothetical protein
LAALCVAAGGGFGLYAALDDNIGAGAASGFLCLFSAPCLIAAVVATIFIARAPHKPRGFDVLVKDERR